MPIHDTLEDAGPGLSEFVGASQAVLARHFDLDVVVMATVDPASGLETTCEVAGVPKDPQREYRLFELEWYAEEPLRFHELARSDVPAGALRLSANPQEVRRHAELAAPLGGFDELRLACVADGMWWGTVTGHRMTGRQAFTEEEVGRVAALSEVLARRFRQAFLNAAVETPGDMADPPGAYVIDRSGHPVSTSESAERLLCHLSPERVMTVNRALAAGVATGERPTFTVAAEVGSLAFHAEPVKGADAQVSVVVERPRPIQLTPLIVAAYRLTPREREVAELVLDGLLTKQIARRLEISEYTVQDHLKSLFAKTGTGTRGELCAELFTRFYRPRSEEGVSPGPYGFFMD